MISGRDEICGLPRDKQWSCRFWHWQLDLWKSDVSVEAMRSCRHPEQWRGRKMVFRCRDGKGDQYKHNVLPNNRELWRYWDSITVLTFGDWWIGFLCSMIARVTVSGSGCNDAKSCWTVEFKISRKYWICRVVSLYLSEIGLLLALKQ